jgi:hypothetical protein
MPKTTLEKSIETAAANFALSIVGAVKGATLAELIALQEGTPKRRGKKLGRKPGRKPKAAVAPVKRKGKRISRTDKAALLDTIVAHLKKNPNSGCSAVAKKFKLPSKNMGLYLKELRAKGRVGAVGKKVGMTYSVK